jgi:hypothetical protein
MGQAVQKAAQDARGQFLQAAAAVLRAPVSDIRLDNGMVVCGEQMLSFTEVMQRYFRDTEGEILGRGFFKVQRDDNVPLGYPSPFWEIGLGAAEVEVDSETGEVKILRYVSLTDAENDSPASVSCSRRGAVSAQSGIVRGSRLPGWTTGQWQPCGLSLRDYDLPESFTTYNGGCGVRAMGRKAWRGGISPWRGGRQRRAQRHCRSRYAVPEMV